MAITKNQVKKAAASYVKENEEDRQPIEKKKPISFYIRPSIYEKIQRLAHYRGTSAGTLIDEVLGNYMDECAEELKAFDDFSRKMAAKRKG